MSDSDSIASWRDDVHAHELPCVFARDGAFIAGWGAHNWWRGFSDRAARLCTGASLVGWGYLLEFTGTIDDLLAAGVAEPAWFPITTKCGRQTRRDRWATRVTIEHRPGGQVLVRRWLDFEKRASGWGADPCLGLIEPMQRTRRHLRLVIDNTRRAGAFRYGSDDWTPPEAA
jgi:hypothetical protein